ncbi:MAG: type II secretion system protein GspL, partial [Casimicrobiaceae bacterium]
QLIPMADPEFAGANISVADVARRLGVAGFGAWWLQELASLVPARMRGAIARRKLRPVIALDTERITFWRPSQQGETPGMREAASIANSTDTAAVAAQGRAALDAIFALTPGMRDVTLALSARQVLRRSLKLPAAVEENLRATIGYDIDRLTPFKPEDLHFDAVVVDRDPAKREITVDVVTVRRRLVDQALSLARSFGANVVAVVADAPRDAAASRINLLTPEDRVDGNRLLRWRLLVPLALLLVLGVAVIAVPLWHKRDYAIAMMNTADEAATRAQQSDRLRGELDRMVGEYNFALERKYTTPGVAQVLDEVTRLLPDDTWLTQFEIKSSIRGKLAQRELFMRGESANAGKLISLLENATLVGQAAPRSPTTKLQPGPGESFDIGAQLKTTPVPQKIALTEATRPPPASVAPPPPATATSPAAVPAATRAAPAASPAAAPPAVAKGTLDGESADDAADAPAAPRATGRRGGIARPVRNGEGGGGNGRGARARAAQSQMAPAPALPAGSAGNPATDAPAADDNGAEEAQ